jgi:hypothetical protein
MKLLSPFLVLVIILASGFKPGQDSNVEFVCMRTHKSTNTCYFNFIVDGGKYSYRDAGCKKSRNKEETIKKIKEGKLAMVKNWTIDCPESKEKQ